MTRHNSPSSGETAGEVVENRQSFFARISPFTPPSALLDIELAYTLAKYAHRSQVRSERGPDGEPLRYFEHPRRVALILIDEVGVADPEIVCAALLHDGIEDTRDLTAAMIEHVWGSEVTRLVQVLSKAPKAGYEERLAIHGDWKALLIKACDRLDNLRSMGPDQVTDAFRERKFAETRTHYFGLFDRLLALAPPAYEPKVARVVDEIRSIAAA